MARAARNPSIPARDGVSPSCVALPDTGTRTPWALMLDFLCERLPAINRTCWAQRMTDGDVLSEHGLAVAPDTPYQGGQRLYYWRTLDTEQPIPFDAHIRFQDEHLLIADKPHFLPVTPTGRFVQETLLVRMKRFTGIDTLSPIHRIDRETAGLVVFSVRPQDRGAYQALFRDRQVSKTYEAIAPVHPDWPGPVTRISRMVEDPNAFYRMIEVDGPANSETSIDIIERAGAWARYHLSPLTGKRHQLRVHMNGLGTPIAGDQFYPSVQRGPDAPEDFSQPLRLLAQAIAFTDPVTGAERRFQSALTLDWPHPAS